MRTIIGSVRPRISTCCCGKASAGKPGRRANLFRYDSLASDALCHVLKPCRDIDRIPERSEHDVIAITDVTDDHFAGMNPDAESDRFAEIVF